MPQMNLSDDQSESWGAEGEAVEMWQARGVEESAVEDEGDKGQTENTCPKTGAVWQPYCGGGGNKVGIEGKIML